MSSETDHARKMSTSHLPPVIFELPNREDALPIITPHHIALCFLSKGYLSPGLDDAGGTWPQRQALGDALLTAIREADAVREPSIRVLATRLEIAVTHNLMFTKFADDGHYAHLVIKSLQAHMRAENILDRLLQLFNQLANMVTTSTNSRAEDSVGADDNSVMGFFLRRCWCDFTALSFEETCCLAAACERYSQGFDCQNLDAEYMEYGTLRSRAITDRYLGKHIFEADLLTGPREVIHFEAPVTDLLSHTRNSIPEGLRASRAYFILKNDPLNVVEALHNEFDSQNTPFFPSIAMVASGDTPCEPRDRSRLQTAALALAATHVRLGHVDIGFEALNEALRTAQVAKDDATLPHILAVICQLMETAPPGTTELLMGGDPLHSTSTGSSSSSSTGAAAAAEKSEAHVAELRVMLDHLLSRGEAKGLPHLAAYARLALARHALIYPVKSSADADLTKSTTTDLFLDPENSGGGGGEDTKNHQFFFGSKPTTTSTTTTTTTSVYPTSACPAATEIAAAARYLAHLHLGSALCAAVPTPPASSSGLACLRILKSLSDIFISTPIAFGGPMRGAQAASAVEVRRLAGAVPLLRAAGYSVFGNKRLVQGHALVFLEAQSRRGSSENKAVALAQLAVTVAEDHGFQAVEKILEVGVSKHFPEWSNKVMYAARLTIAHRRACHRREMVYALELAGMMLALGNYSNSGGGGGGGGGDSTSNGNTAAAAVKASNNGTKKDGEKGEKEEQEQEGAAALIDYRLAAAEMTAEAFFYGGELETAMKIGRDQVLCTAKQYSQPLSYVRTLVLLARIALQMNNLHEAMEYASSAYTQSKEIHAGVLQAEAVLVTARILRKLGKAHLSRALIELDALMPFVMAHGGLYLRGRCRLEMARALMEEGGSAEGVKEEGVDGTLPLVVEAKYDFRRLEAFREVQECVYVEGMVQGAVNNMSGSKRCAEELNHLEKEGVDGLAPIAMYWPVKHRHDDDPDTTATIADTIERKGEEDCGVGEQQPSPTSTSSVAMSE